MAGPIDYDPPPLPPARPADVVVVMRYDAGGGSFELMTNVRAARVEYRLGADPGRAALRYAFDELADPGLPRRVEQVLPLAAAGPGVIAPDDRVVVAVLDPSGGYHWLFDGFAQRPDGHLDPQSEAVTVNCLGVAVREWDAPLAGSTWREAETPTDAGANIETTLPGRINPGGKANAVDAGREALRDSGADAFLYPVFLDPAACAARKIGRKWTLDMAARYLIAVGNPDKTWTDYPNYVSITSLLDAWAPSAEGGAIDPLDPSTYETYPIVLREAVLTGRAWPDMLWDLLRPHGFGMRFALYDVGGFPRTGLFLWRRDGGWTPLRTLHLQPPGSALDPGLSNVATLRVARDGNAIVNAVTVETAPAEYEADFVLAPGFAVQAQDVDSRASFKTTASDFGQYRDKYRLWIFDEDGSGHTNMTDMSWVADPAGTSLVEVLGGPDLDANLYVTRRRPGRNTLLSRDAANQPRKAVLQVSTDYAGEVPGLWDGTGTWRTVKGDWAVLPDRLGVRFTGLDPNAVSVGAPGSSGGKAGGQQLRLVEWLNASPPTKLYFKLTTVIEGDRTAECVAPRRAASPSQFEVMQHIDAKDRYKFQVVTPFSMFNENGVDGDAVIARDDIPDALADAYARRQAQEFGRFAGEVVIPRLDLGYQVGDRVEGVLGRGISFVQNSDLDQGEGPAYAAVAGVAYAADGGQSTTLQLADLRMDKGDRR